MLSCPVPAEPSRRLGPWASLAGGLGAVLLPKCPLCLAAYGSALGAMGLGTSAQRWLLEPVIVGAVMASVVLTAFLGLRHRDAVTPLAAAIGAALAIGGRLGLESPALTAVGGVLLVGAALAASVRCRAPAV